MFLKRKILSVETCGSPVLKKVSMPVAAIDDELCKLAADMIATMRYFDGVGLAAPQVGINVRLVTFALPMPRTTESLRVEEEIFLKRMPLAVINPQIISASEQTEIADEGCLSVPDIFGPVERPARISFCCTLLDGSSFACECGGLAARCVQHEIDHLDGRLFIDRIEESELEGLQSEIDTLMDYGRQHDFKRKNK